MNGEKIPVTERPTTSANGMNPTGSNLVWLGYRATAANNLLDKPPKPVV